MKKTPYAKKSFGQNFLVDQTYVLKVIEALELDKSDTVVEIGPGRGALTEHLVADAGKVIGIEVEHEMIAVLRERFAETSNFSLIEQDALTIDFNELPGIGNSPVKLVANLPYYISTAILQVLLEHRHVFSEMVLMFQKEVVERITARPGSSERGFLTVLVQAYADVETLFEVPPRAFRPVPKVNSSVVRITPKKSGIENYDEFRRLVSAAFAQKRKTLLNNLKLLYQNAGALLDVAEIDPKRRAETLSIDEWSILMKTLTNARNNGPS